MRIVVSDEDTIASWLYPGIDGLPYPPGSCFETPELDETDFAALWHAITPHGKVGPALTDESTHCDVGFSHDALEWVARVTPELLQALLAVPHHERWRVAQNWASNRLERRPNDQQLSDHKKWVKQLATLAEEAFATGQMVLLIPNLADDRD